MLLANKHANGIPLLPFKFIIGEGSLLNLEIYGQASTRPEPLRYAVADKFPMMAVIFTFGIRRLVGKHNRKFLIINDKTNINIAKISML